MLSVIVSTYQSNPTNIIFQQISLLLYFEKSYSNKEFTKTMAFCKKQTTTILINYLGYASKQNVPRLKFKSTKD